MEPKGKQILRINHMYILDNLRPQDILDRLFTTETLTWDDKERIDAEATARDKTRKLLQILYTKREGYEHFCESLKDFDFIRQKLEDTKIDSEKIAKDEDEKKNNIIKLVELLYCENVSGINELSVSDIVKDLRERYESAGKVFDIAERVIEGAISEKFPNVQRLKKKKKPPRYKYLERKPLDEDAEEKDEMVDEGDFSQAEDAKQSNVTETVKDVNAKIAELDEDELCNFLKPYFEQEKLDTALLQTFVKEDVSGKIFVELAIEDLKDIFPYLSFGKRKTILIMKSNLLREEENMVKEGKYLVSRKVLVLSDSPPDEENKPDNTDRWTVEPFKETFRKFDAEVKDTDKYRKHAVLQTSNFKPSNLIEPVHRFVHKTLPKNEIPSWIASEALYFISACLNDRSNGTIHFGVEECMMSDRLQGEIIGIQAKQRDVHSVLYKKIREHFYTDDFETVCRCIRPPKFIEVTDRTHRYVVEIDVVPQSELVQENAFWMKNGKIALYRFGIETSGPTILNEEQIRDFMNQKQTLSIHRKEQEEKPKYGEVRKDLRQKFLNLFSAGIENLSENIYPVLFLGPADGDLDTEFGDEDFQFIHDIDPSVIFDFDSYRESLSMYDFVERKQEKVVKVLTTDHFDKSSDENMPNKDSFNNLLDDLRTTTTKPWVFCNGHEPLEKQPMKILDWKQSRSEGFKDAVRFYSDEIPTGRAIAIFFLFSKNYDIMLEAAEEVLVKFKNNWIVLAESEETASHWKSELLRRQSVNKETLTDRSVIGIPWRHFNDMVKQIMGTKEFSSCEVTTSTGAFCSVKEKIKNELCDLELLSRNQCDSQEIVKHQEKLRQHLHEEQEHFFRGEEVTWWNFWCRDEHVLKRSQHDVLLDLMKSSLEGENNEDENKVSIVNLYHQPGAGGTTTAKHILWDLRRKYRCCIVRNITDQTCDQIEKFRNYEDLEPTPPIVLIDNGDEEKINMLHALLEERARIVSRSGVSFRVFCVLFQCIRRANLGKDVDRRSVQLKHDLTPAELGWFNSKYDLLHNKFEEGIGSDPRLLISFNILKENFNQDYIKRAVQDFVKSIENDDELCLLKYLSLINTYDLDFQQVPISAFDGLMQNSKTPLMTFGSVSGARQRMNNSMPSKENIGQTRKRHWESRLSQSLLVLLNRSAKMDFGSALNSLSIINKLFAKEIFDYVLTESNKSVSEIMHEFLTSKIFLNINRSINLLLKIVRDILKKREFLESGRKDLFSPLILDIMRKEGKDAAVKVLEKGFETTKDAMLAQQIARFYIHCKNWDKAEKYAKDATIAKPENSYLWDTYGQISKRQLAEKLLECYSEGKKLSDIEFSHIIRIARTGMSKFSKEQRVSEEEKTPRTNDAGYFGEVRVVILLLDLMCFWPPTENKNDLHRFLINDTFFPPKFENNLGDDEFGFLKKIYRRGETLMRVIEEKNAQLKNDIYSDICASTFRPDNEITLLRENLNSYFGEDSNTVPPDLSEEQKAAFIRRRVQRLGGRSWLNLYNLGDDKNTLETIFDFMMQNTISKFKTEFDLVTLLHVTIVSHINSVSQRIQIPFSELLIHSKTLYDMARNTRNDRPLLEAYMYFVMLHWPTDSRIKYAQHLCPVKQVQTAIKEWKAAFNNNHPRQRDENSPFRRRETTHFFLGKGEGLKEIVHHTEMIVKDGSKYIRGDMIWHRPEIKNRFQTLKGTLTKEGREIIVQVKSPTGNICTIPIQTALPIGQRSIWNKTVYFYVGFSFWGPKAFNVSMEEPDITGVSSMEPKYKQHISRGEPRSNHSKVATNEMYLKKLRQIDKRLEQIEKLKAKPKKSNHEREEIRNEASLKKQRNDLFKKRHQILTTENDF